MMKRARVISYFLALLVLVSWSLRAQAEVSSDANTFEAPAVVVSADRTPVDAHRVTSSVTVVTADEIARSGKQDVVEVLRDVPGVSVYSTGGAGQVTYAFLRGLNAGQTLVLIDGVMMNDPSNPSKAYDFSGLSLSSIERIEVVRGAQSVVHGSQAMGGVIQIFTKKGSKAESAPVFGYSVLGGRYSTSAVALSVRGNQSGLRYFFAGENLSTAGYSVAADPSPAADKDGRRLATLTSSLQKSLGDATDVSVLARFSYSRANADAGAYLDGAGVARSRALYSKAQLDHCFDSGATLKLGQTVSILQRDYSHFDDVQGPYAGRSQKTSLQGSWLLGSKASGVLFAEYGSESADFKDQTPILLGVSQSTTSLGAEVKGEASALSMTAGLRLDHNSQFGNFTTFKVAPGVALRKDLFLRTSVGTGFRAPSLYELNEAAWGYGNPSLRPEKTLGTDVGLEWESREAGASAGATVFQSRVQDQIVADSMGRAQNLGKTLSQGLELSARKAWEKGDLRSSVTRLFVARNELTGAELPQRPKLQATVGAGFRVTEGTRVDAQFRFHGSRRNTYPDVALPAYSLLDLSGRFQFTRSVGLQAKLENLLDRTYQEVAGYNTPGRSLSIGVEGAF